MVYKVWIVNDITQEDMTISDDLTVGDDLTAKDLIVTGTLTLWGVAQTGGIILGAGDDLVGSSTSDITINTDKFTVAWATGNTAVWGTLWVTGLATLTAGITGKFILASTETIAGGGTTTALDLTKTLHNIDADAGGDTFTLADWIAGQIMICVLKTATGTATITPATFLWGTSITLNAAGDSVMLVFQTTLGWSIVGWNSYAVS